MKPLIPAACVAAAVAMAAADARRPAAAPRRPAAGARHPAAAPRHRAAPRIIQLPDLPASPDLGGPPRQCPAAFRGANLDLRAIPGGVDLELTSSQPDRVPELREQVREAAFILARYSKAPPPELGERRPRVPPLEISVTDVEAGARARVRAQRARDLPELLDLARTFEIFWSHSDCNEDVYVRGRASLPYLRV